MRAVQMQQADKPHPESGVDGSSAVNPAADRPAAAGASAVAAASLSTAAHRGGVPGKHTGKGEKKRTEPKVEKHTVEAKDSAPEDPLAVALALDAPLTLTACENANVIARLPLRFKDILPIIWQQLEFRQRQVMHQTSIDAEDYTCKDNPLTSPTSLTVEEIPHSSPPYQHAHLSDMVMRLLPIAVGSTRSCKTSLMHALDNEDESTGKEEEAQVPMNIKEYHQQQQQLAKAEAEAEAEAEAYRGEADLREAGDAVPDVPALTHMTEHEIYRTQTTEKLLDYLFSSEALTNGSGNGYLDEARRSFTVATCLSGLREVSSDTVEYADVLRQLISFADAQRGAETSGAVGDAEAQLPAYVRDLLVGVMSSENASPATPLAQCIVEASTSLHTTAHPGNPSNSTAHGLDLIPYDAANAVAAVQRMPVVTQTLRSTLDAVLPPRLFIYYSIHQDTAVAVQEQRQAAKLRLVNLRRHLEEHPSDTHARAEVEDLRSALAVELKERRVGTIVVILQRTSDAHSPRNYLVSLEQTLDEVLREIMARCCGRPLKIATATTTAAAAAAKKKQQRAASPSVLSSETKPSRASTGKTREVKENVRILSLPDHPVCTRTLKPLPAQPAPTSVSGGGSATVAATLNVLEVNKERTLVQLNLLGEELLRQVTVDLPERGILFRRILDEAQLSMNARAIVARERFKATQERLLDGQDAREETEARRGALEKEVVELQSKLAYVTARRAGLKVWVAEKKAAETKERRERIHFETKLRERLTKHTEAVKIAQDAARRGSLNE